MGVSTLAKTGLSNSITDAASADLTASQTESTVEMDAFQVMEQKAALGNTEETLATGEQQGELANAQGLAETANRNMKVS
jgi:hypothetical protein